MTGRGHQPRIANVSAPMRHVGRAAVWMTLALAVTACSLLPGSSPSPRELALRQLAANQALWTQKHPLDYVITIERQCFCPSAQYEITVSDDIVQSVSHDGAPVAPAEVQGLPKTVPQLFAVVAGLPPDAAVEVSYDPDLGFPTSIRVDPIPNAVDDEYTIVVHRFQALPRA